MHDERDVRKPPDGNDLSRRDFLEQATAGAALLGAGLAATAYAEDDSPIHAEAKLLTVVLSLLRNDDNQARLDHAPLLGALINPSIRQQKSCDHGQCSAATHR